MIVCKENCQWKKFKTFFSEGIICWLHLLSSFLRNAIWIAQSVYRFATGWTRRGSNPSGEESFRTRPGWPPSHFSLLYDRANAALPRVKQRRRVVHDLNFLHFCVWRPENSAIYLADVSDMTFLQKRTQNGFETIRMTPGIFQGVRQSLFTRATSCVKARGGYFEHFV